MARPKVIIAESETDILFPLQKKFVEEFFDQIDLEIISDPDYFRRKVSESINADVLIVSESLFDSSLQRHNIPYLFLLTEREDDKATVELDITRIHKYTSVQQIFQEVTAKAGPKLSTDQKAPKETQIILVTSAGGGTGKSTIAIGLSAALARNYRRVLYLNAVQLQTFQRILENGSPILETEVYAKLSGKGNFEGYQEVKHLIRNERFSYLPPFKAALISLGLDRSVFEAIARGAKISGDYDYVVIDTDGEFDREKIRMLDLADRVIVVTRQTEASVYATNLLISNINGVSSEKYRFICNDYQVSQGNWLNSEKEIRFSVDEYLDHIPDCEHFGPEQFFRDTRFQKMTFLIE